MTAPPGTRRPGTRARIACVTLAGALALAGCGSSKPSGTSADPASAVPATAVLYTGAVVRPQGTLASDALAAGHALTEQKDPYLRLLPFLQSPGSKQLNFKRDVAPWLGPNAAVFLTSLHAARPLATLLEQGLLGRSGSASFPFSSATAQGAVVLDTSDSAAARTFLQTQAKRAGAHPASFHGVAFQTSSAGVAFALVDRFAVIGSEAGVRGVIEATHGGEPLSRSSQYTRLAHTAPGGALAHVYTATPSASIATGGEGGVSTLLGVLAGGHAANVSLIPAPASFAFAADTIGSSGGLLAVDPQAVRAFDELPEGSWLAIGLGDLAGEIGTDAQELETLASLGIPKAGPLAPTATTGFGSLVQSLLLPLHILGSGNARTRHELTSWMGSGGVFASGSSLTELKGAVVISSSDPALSRAAVHALAARLRSQGGLVSPASIPGTDAAVSVGLTGLPVRLYIADGAAGGGHTAFVIGMSEESVRDALHPSATMASSTARAAAASSLGERIQPSLLVNFPPFLNLLEGLGLANLPPLSEALPYLRSSTTLAGGGRTLGAGVERFRLQLGLQGGEAGG